MIFYFILAGLFYVHSLKPFGYLGMAIGSIVMTYAFKGKKGKKPPPSEKLD